MAFGQASGPPASHKDVQRLEELLAQAGFASFREARHPYGLTQRQAAGKFTRDEALALIERLEGEATFAAPAPADELALAATPDDALVAELELRGWTCIPPVHR